MMDTNFEQFTVKHPSWIKDITIYEVYLRQYSPSGTIKEFMPHLPRLKEMGVDVLWLMPIQPIGEKNKKGSMGSPYAIRDYVSVNPEHGTLDDLKKLVKEAHKLGMYVILDWVANHTAWDHTWIEQHPDFYVKNHEGHIVHPANTDWFDVADLNFDNPALREEMIRSLKYWVQEADIDGYRCDMAGLVPTWFWEEARAELDKLKKVFMLAEAEQADMHYKAFDASYNWAVHHIMNDIAQGRKSVWDLDECFKYDVQIYPPNAIRMYFTSNHDENKNAGSALERMGDAFYAFTVMSYTVPGIPLIFSGQEVGLNRRLEFFEKDQIDWTFNHNYDEFYKKLSKLRKDQKALWSGNDGGPMQRINTNRNDRIFTFLREKGKSKVLTVLNLSPDYQDFTLEIGDNLLNLKSFFTGQTLGSQHQNMLPWGYQIYLL